MAQRYAGLRCVSRRKIEWLLCDSHDEFVRLYQIDKKDLIKQGANEVDLFILPDELI